MRFYVVFAVFITALMSLADPAIAMPHHGVRLMTRSSPSVYFCDEAGFKGACSTLAITLKPCTKTADSSVSSFRTSDNHVQCTLYANDNCSGAALVVQGTTGEPNLGGHGFDNKTQSFSCRRFT